MIIEPVPWFSDRKICPADYDLAEYINLHSSEIESIFHLGPGYDHYLANHIPELIDLLAITHSPAEMASYMSMIIATPQIANHYMVVFCDLYNLNPTFFFPDPDLLTLFHLGEKELVNHTHLDSVIEFINPKMIALYQGSIGYLSTLDVIQTTGLYKTKEQYKSIMLYEKYNAVESKDE